MRTKLLWLIWIGWVVVFLLVVGLFAASLPHAVFDVKYYEWQVQVARPVAATIFPTYDAFVTYLLVLRLSAVAVFWGTAVYLVWRKPKEWMVVYVSATLLMMSYMFVFQSDMDRWRFPNELLELFPAIEWIAPSLFFISFFLLFYLFPDGRLTPKWIWVLGAAVTGVAILFFSRLETDLNISEEMAWVLFVLSIFVFALLGLISQVLKWRKTTVVEKQQTRLVLFSLGLFIALPLIQTIISLLIGDVPLLHFLSLYLFLFGATLIPITIGFSALRFRLWQMDVLLNRTLVYGTLTAVTFLLYIFFVGGLGVLFQSSDNLLLAVIATGLTAALFDPLRRRLQLSVNHLMYGQRDEPLVVLAQLGKQMEQSADPQTILPTAVHVIAQALKLPAVALSIIEDETETVVATTGKIDPQTVQRFALIVQAEPIGHLSVAPRAAGTPFSKREVALLQELARQTAVAAHALRLNRALRHSRRQLVTAQAEERRRVSRVLHDRLGAQLAVLLLQADSARQQLTDDPQKVAADLQTLKTGTQTAVQEVRTLIAALDAKP